MARWIWKTLAFLAACAGLTFAAAAGWIATHLDDPPIDDRDLRVEFAPLADTDNGALQIDAIARRVAWPESESTSVRLHALARGGAWDEALATRWLDLNVPWIPALDAALAERVRFAARLPYSAESPAGSSWCRLGDVVGLRAVATARRGDLARAFDDVLRALRLARAIESAEHADTTQLIVARRIRRTARLALGAVVSDARLSPETSLLWAERLGAVAPDPSSWKSAWAEDYRFWSALSHAQALPEIRVESAWWVPERYLFKPNASDALRADFYRTLQRWADRPCYAAPVGALLRPASSGDRLRTLVAPNGGFKAVLMPTLVESEIEISAGRCRIASDHAALVALVGLAAYRAEHGELPSALDALVPTYLPALPQDGFDGAPLRYDRTNRLLWTVGAGDSPEKASPFQPDFKFPIPF